MGVSTALWNMVKGAMKLGLPKDTIIRLIRSIQAGIADETPQREEEEEDAEAEHVEEEVVNSTDIMMVEQPPEVDKSAVCSPFYHPHSNADYTCSWTRRTQMHGGPTQQWLLLLLSKPMRPSNRNEP